MLSRPKKPKKFPEQETRIQTWFVTFADLMGLSLSFFVMMLSFSTQDLHKLQILAVSMRGAFGAQPAVREPGAVPGNALRPPADAASAPPLKAEREFEMAAASLRQALRDLPELAAMSDNIILRQTPRSFALEIVDRSSYPMFRQGSAVPYDGIRVLIQKLASPLRATALRVSIVGHASVDETLRGDTDVFDLSMRRADMVRRILKRDGLPTSQLSVVAGKGDTEPLFADDPAAAGNRRVTIALVYDDEALPPELRPSRD